jgi:exopolysaccharide biosynthesis polyprenyl glycosylphosphotransferase
MRIEGAIEADQVAELASRLNSEGLHTHERLVATRPRNRDYVLRRLLLATDLTGILLAMLISLVLFTNRPDPVRTTLLLVPTLIVWALLFRSYGLYERQVRRTDVSILDDTAALFHAVVLGTLATWLYSKWMLGGERLAMTELLVFAVVAIAATSLLRSLMLRLHLRARGPEQIVLAAGAETAERLSRIFTRHPEYGMQLRGAVLPNEGPDQQLSSGLDPLPQELDRMIEDRNMDHLMVQSGPGMDNDEIVRLMRLCHRNLIRFSVLPTHRQTLNPGAEIDRIEGLGVLVYHPSMLSPSSRLLKRGVDIAISAIALVLFAPVLPLIALAIALDSRGTILFKQTRVGRYGRRFRLLKFRTMVQDADHMVDGLMAQSKDPDCLSLAKDPRVTRVGRFLRVTSLDEIPQLWNVLVGDMSLVGPRPLPERDDRKIEGWSRHRLDLRPGLTGPWQVSGRNNIPFREMVDIDSDYASGWSLWGDFRLILRTVPVVLSRRGSN